MTEALALSGAINIIAGGLLGFVGWQLSRRAVAQTAQSAHTLFVAWWIGLGFYTLVGGALNLAASFGVTHLGLHVVLRYITWVLICGATFGLVYYLVYLFSGNRRWLVPLAIFYGALALGLVREVYTHRPIGVEVRRWRVDLDYAVPLGSTFQIILLLLGVSIIVASIAYFTLFFRLDSRPQRYRVLLVSVSLFVWTLGGLLARLAEHDWWQLLTRGVLTLFVALVILMAYEPHPRIRSWLGEEDPVAA